MLAVVDYGVGNLFSLTCSLRAVGVEKELLESTIRFSLSGFNTEEEIDYTCRNLEEIVPMLRRYTRH